MYLEKLEPSDEEWKEMTELVVNSVIEDVECTEVSLYSTTMDGKYLSSFIERCERKLRFRFDVQNEQITDEFITLRTPDIQVEGMPVTQFTSLETASAEGQVRITLASPLSFTVSNETSTAPDSCGCFIFVSVGAGKGSYWESIFELRQQNGKWIIVEEVITGIS